MADLILSLYNSWKTSPLRVWIRDFNDLPAKPDTLARHASVLHDHAQQSVWIGTIVGFVCGFAVAGFTFLIQMLFANLNAFVEGWNSGEFGDVVARVGQNSEPGAAPALAFLAITFLGFYLGNRRAYQLRSTAAIALSVSRLEEKLDRMIGPALEQGDRH